MRTCTNGIGRINLGRLPLSKLDPEVCIQQRRRHTSSLKTRSNAQANENSLREHSTFMDFQAFQQSLAEARRSASASFRETHVVFEAEIARKYDSLVNYPLWCSIVKLESQQGTHGFLHIPHLIQLLIPRPTRILFCAPSMKLNPSGTGMLKQMKRRCSVVTVR